MPLNAPLFLKGFFTASFFNLSLSSSILLLIKWWGSVACSPHACSEGGQCAQMAQQKPNARF